MASACRGHPKEKRGVHEEARALRDETCVDDERGACCCPPRPGLAWPGLTLQAVVWLSAWYGGCVWHVVVRLVRQLERPGRGHAPEAAVRIAEEEEGPSCVVSLVAEGEPAGFRAALVPTGAGRMCSM